MAKPSVKPTGVSEVFWQGCNRSVLLHQTCATCHRPQFYPRRHCAACGGDELSWSTSAGKGTIHAVTTVHRAGNKAFDADVPFQIALVDLDEGFRMMMNVVGPGCEAAAIGDRIVVTFLPDPVGQLLPQAVLQA